MTGGAILYTEEVLAALYRTLPEAEFQEVSAKFAALLAEAGDLLAQRLGVKALINPDFWDDHLAVTFTPASDGQPIPEVLEEFDPGCDWAVS